MRLTPAAGRRSADARSVVPPRSRALRLWGRYLGIACALGIATGVGVGAAIHMPRVETLAEFRPGQITQLYDRQGALFSSYSRERRFMLQEGDLPEVLQNAVVAAEDSEFFSHGGVDPLGIVRAFFVNLERGRHAQGASTITMQLARRLFLTPEKSWRRKVEEALLAVELEKTLSKQQILTLYCNIEFFGSGNYGVEAAARFYFGKSVRELSIAQAATLAGILQRPSEYSPYRNPDAVLRRRNYVLNRMLANGFIDRTAYDQAVAQPLAVERHRVQGEVGSYFAEEVRQYLEGRYGADRLYEEGMQVQTTLDGAMQRTAEVAVRDGLLRLDHRKGWRGPLYRGRLAEVSSTEPFEIADRNPVPESWLAGLVLESRGDLARIKIQSQTYTLTKKGIAWTGKEGPASFLRAGDVAWFRIETPEKSGEEPYLVLEQEPLMEGAALILDSATGAVRALVGGWDFRRNKYDRATQAERQVGSAFKPFVYGAALESGFSPADTLFDAPAVFIGADGLPSYSPRNYYRRYYGIITLRRALELSVNVTSVKLLDLVGASHVVDFGQRCGLRSPLPPYPSLALGSADLIPIQVAAAYATFANEGVYVEPYFVDRVLSRGGQVLEEHTVKARKAMDPNVAYVLTHMLEGVVDRGTAGKAASLPLDLAGKTGTTNDYTDAWFIGFTPHYTILTWTGYDQKRSLGRRMTGAEAALPTWMEIVEHGLAEGWIATGETFHRPAGVVMQAVESHTGLLPGPGADSILEEAFLPGTVPDRVFEARWNRILELPWPQQRAFYHPRARERMPENVVDWGAIQQAWTADDEKGN